jgi:hypothetical protein
VIQRKPNKSIKVIPRFARHWTYPARQRCSFNHTRVRVRTVKSLIMERDTQRLRQPIVLVYEVLGNALKIIGYRFHY